MYGLPAELDPINDIARRHNLLVIEDATLALGASYRDRPAGTLGDAAFFSFAPRKVIGGAGNGGMVVTADADLARGVRLLRAYGLDPERGEMPAAWRQSAPGADHLAEGYNLKLDGMQAAIVGEKLRCLEDWQTRRQAAADDYTARLAGVDTVAPPVVPAHLRHAWRNYVVQVPERDRIRAIMREQGVATAVLYTPPVHLQSVYRGLGYAAGDFPRAEAVAKKLLALPMHPGLDKSQTTHVVDALVTALDRIGV
jgi:dTDP-4-amino-4,6-dideoxygalactose transaminase